MHVKVSNLERATMYLPRKFRDVTVIKPVEDRDGQAKVKHATCDPGPEGNDFTVFDSLEQCLESGMPFCTWNCMWRAFRGHKKCLKVSAVCNSYDGEAFIIVRGKVPMWQTVSSEKACWKSHASAAFADSLIACKSRCDQDDLCQAVDFFDGKKVCHLLPEPCSTEPTVYGPGASHHRKNRFFLLDNSELKSKMQGVSFRSSQDNSKKLKYWLPWQSVVSGALHGEWLEIYEQAEPEDVQFVMLYINSEVSAWRVRPASQAVQLPPAALACRSM
jgi:hypothetical protein